MNRHIRIEADKVAKAPFVSERLLDNMPPLPERHPHAEPRRGRLTQGHETKFRRVPKSSSHLDWQTVIIWLFVATLTVLSFLAGYQLWSKLSFR